MSGCIKRRIHLIHFSLALVFSTHIGSSSSLPKSDSLYIALTGKNKSELLQSGAFFTLPEFGNDDKATDDLTNPQLESDDGPSANLRAEKFLPVSYIIALKKNVSSIKFLLYTQKNKDVGESLEEGRPETFFTSNWNLNQPVKLLVHGFRGDCERDAFSLQLITAYITTKKNYNIVCMDWKNLATDDDYFEAAKNTQKAAQRLVEFLGFLKRSGYVRGLNIVHIVAYDLGSHVAGVAGMQIQKNGEGLVGRITGLDPSGAFMKAPLENRLDSTDADFVDVIHTNMGSLKQGYLGISLMSGHQDFLPNGGRFMPTCASSIVGDIISTCSHRESFMLFAKTIRDKTKLIGCKCIDWPSFLKGECGDCKKGPIMGENAKKEGGLGAYYLRVEVKNK